MKLGEHAPVLKRTGTVLLVVGLLDIAVMVYCIVQRISYSSSFNIFAAVAGVFLLRGSLKAASLVRWFAAFFLSCLVTLPFAWPFIQPIDLTHTEVRLEPLSAIAVLGLLSFIAALLVWLYRQLGSALVLQAQAEAGLKVRDMRIPMASGTGLVLLFAIALPLLLGGESGTKAKAIAQQQLGAAYRYHVSSLSIAKNAQGTFISGTVTAWNETEVRSVPFNWQEP